MTARRGFGLAVLLVLIASLLGGVRQADAGHSGSPIVGYWDGYYWSTATLEGQPTKQRLTVWGWTATDDYPVTALGVRVTIDGWPVDADWEFANQYRPDVAAVFPQYGAYHGFGFTISLPRVGWRTVCIQAQYSGHYHDLPGSGCRWLNTNEWPDNGSVPSYTARWNRFRYADPTLRLRFQLNHVSGGSFSSAQWQSIRDAVYMLETNSASRVDFTEAGIGGGDVGITIQKVASIAGAPPGTEGALTNVKFYNCSDWNLGASADLFGSAAYVGCFARQATVQLTDTLLAYPPNIPYTAPHEVGHGLLLGHLFDHLYSLMCSPACASSTFSNTDRLTLGEVYRWP